VVGLDSHPPAAESLGDRPGGVAPGERVEDHLPRVGQEPDEEVDE
jgi:hypothetical protein